MPPAVKEYQHNEVAVDCPVLLKTVRPLSTIDTCTPSMMMPNEMLTTIDVANLPKGTLLRPNRQSNTIEVTMPRSRWSPISSPKFARKKKATQNGATLERKKSIGRIYDCQLYGVLLKKVEKKGRPTRFVKRFFILKENFLIYFPVTTTSKLIRKCQLCVHPKGVVMLSNATITPIDAAVNHKCAILLMNNSPECDSNDDATSVVTSVSQQVKKSKDLVIPGAGANRIILVCDTELQRSKWIEALRNAAKITSANARISAAMITELEEQGLRLHREKQEYVDRLETESMALRAQIDKNEELETLRNELVAENRAYEQTCDSLRNDLAKVKRDIELLVQHKNTLEQEKVNLAARNQHLHSTLETLKMEKTKVESKLASTELEKSKSQQENKSLKQMSEQFKRRLDDIEKQQQLLIQEKRAVEKALNESESKLAKVQRERDAHRMQSDRLKAALDDVQLQKKLTEKSLREEAAARQLAEKQLAAAERALSHLEMAMRLSGSQMSELRDEILPDVCRLREFFEEIAQTCYLDANSPQIMKEALSVRSSAFLNKNRLRSSIKRAQQAQRRLSALGDLDEVKDVNNNSEHQGDLNQRVTSPTSGHHANVIC